MQHPRHHKVSLKLKVNFPMALDEAGHNAIRGPPHAPALSAAAFDATTVTSSGAAPVPDPTM